MKRRYPLMVAMAVAFQVSPLFALEGHDHDETTKRGTSAETTEAMKYACPMHADVQSDKPGECPKCGMTLKQMAHDDVPGEDSHKGHNHEHHQ